MLNYVITSITGWLLIVLLAITIAYPFLLRSGALGPVQPFLKRMRPHYCLGYGITAIVLVHASLSMNPSLVAHINPSGLYTATGAFFLVIIQMIVGRSLSQPALTQRGTLRRWHLLIMITLVLLVVGHLLLNSQALQMFMPPSLKTTLSL